MSETFRTSIDIAATPERVFDYFVTPELLVRWMGDFARLEPAPGGLFSVDINGVLIRGHFVRVERPNLIEIAWGEAGNEAMPPGATRLVVTLEARGDRTHVRLEHSGLIPAEAKKHAIGWLHFIERLGVAARGTIPGPIRGRSRRRSSTRPLHELVSEIRRARCARAVLSEALAQGNQRAIAKRCKSLPLRREVLVQHGRERWSSCPGARGHGQGRRRPRRWTRAAIGPGRGSREAAHVEPSNPRRGDPGHRQLRVAPGKWQPKGTRPRHSARSGSMSP